MSDRSINDLCSQLQPIAREFLAQCKAARLNAGLITTWRSFADQDKAKAAGLSNAIAGQSPHNVCDANGNPASCAFDFGIFEDNGHYVADGTDDRYRQAGEIGKGLGLIWGGDWLHPDFDHLEVTAWRTVSASLLT